MSIFVLQIRMYGRLWMWGMRAGRILCASVFLYLLPINQWTKSCSCLIPGQQEKAGEDWEWWGWINQGFRELWQPPVPVGWGRSLLHFQFWIFLERGKRDVENNSVSGEWRETVGIPEIFHPLEQKKKEFLDADSKFKNILISFSRIADREGG